MFNEEFKSKSMLSKKEIYKNCLQKACDTIMPKLCCEEPFLTKGDLQGILDTLRKSIEEPELLKDEAFENLGTVYAQIYSLAKMLDKNSNMLKNAGGKDFITNLCSFTCGTLKETGTTSCVTHITDAESSKLQATLPVTEVVIAHDLLFSIYDFVEHNIVDGYITAIYF